MDTTHLVALIDGLARERERLASAKSGGERRLRTVLVAQREGEIESEKAFLGMVPDADLPAMTDAELLRELFNL